jgi:hypothetical protein
VEARCGWDGCWQVGVAAFSFTFIDAIFFISKGERQFQSILIFLPDS